MKVSSAFIRATQAHTVPKPDPWEKVPRSEWNNIFSQTNVAAKFKYKMWVWDSSIREYVYDDTLREYLFTNLPQVRVSQDNVYGQCLWSGDTQGMVPGVFYTDSDRYFPTTNEEMCFDIRSTEGNGTMLDGASFTLAEAGASLYASGFTPGTYKMELTHYYGIPYEKYWNGQITKGLEIVNLRETHVSYTDDDWFDLDPEIKIFPGYQGELATKGYRLGLAIKVVETHIFKIDYLWQGKVFATSGIGTFCDGIKEIDFQSDGTRWERNQTLERNAFHYVDFDLYRLK
jgi:hypothetical protein